MDMRCPKCNSLVKQGDAFCIVCGTEFIKPEEKTLPVVNTNLNNSGGAVQNNLNNNVQESVNNSTNLGSNDNQNINVFQETFTDDDLINAYMGKNCDKLRTGGFSWCYFFFGQIYLLYRKLYVPFLVLNVISYIIDSLLGKLVLIHFIVTVLFGLVICGSFKSFYLNHATEQVENIKKKNPNASNKELMKICAKNGGTSWGLIVIYYVLLMFISRI